MNSNIKIMTQIALVAAVICIVSPFTIPIGPVPISFGIFAIMLGVYALGWKWGTVSVLLYILIGMVGLPVFSNFKSGLTTLGGPTGGYIIGYIFTSIIAGLFIDKFKHLALHAVGLVLGVLVCYTFGTIWFVQVMEGTNYAKALSLCVYPFIPGDIIKIIISLLVGPKIRSEVRKINANH